MGRCLPAAFQGCLHILAPVLAVEINEGERQRDVEGVGPMWCCRPLAGFKSNGQVNPSSWALGLEGGDKVLTEDLAE